MIQAATKRIYRLATEERQNDNREEFTNDSGRGTDHMIRVKDLKIIYASSRMKGSKPIPTVAKILLAILIVVAVFASITGLLDQGLAQFNQAATPGGSESVIPDIG